MKSLAFPLACLVWQLPGPASAQDDTRNGEAVLKRYESHLAEPQCRHQNSLWRRHYAPFVQRLGDPGSPLLPRFAYVVDSLIAAGLPTEYAAIPFVESHYEPDQRSMLGPAGMWQFTAGTARVHGLRVGGGIDERLSLQVSTRAAIRYLRTLHRQFDGDWRTVIMAYNAGDGRVAGALRRHSLGALSIITRTYVDKVEAISCDITETHAGGKWKHALQRDVPILKLPELRRPLRKP